MTRFVFPGESSEYAQKRQALLDAEIALRNQTEQVAELRRALPLGKRMPDYVFREGPADLTQNESADMRDVKLSELFTDGHDTLIVYHLMFAAADAEPCVMCSMWADGYNAVTPHVEQRSSFVLVAKADIHKLRTWAKHRGWDRIRLLSAHDNTFNRDMQVEDEQGGQSPALSVLTRTPDGVVYHRYTVGADFEETINRGIDPYSPVWALEDATPAGRGDWYPDHSYMPRAG